MLQSGHFICVFEAKCNYVCTGLGEDWSLDTGYGVIGQGGVLVLIQIPSSSVARAAGLNKRWIHAEYRRRSWRHGPGCSEVWTGGNNLYQHKHLI